MNERPTKFILIREVLTKGRIVTNKPKKYCVEYGITRRLDDVKIGDKQEVIEFLKEYLT